MADSTTTVRPNADVSLGGWTLTGGATAHAVLSDDSDGSYCSADASAGGILKVGVTGVTVGDHDLFRYAQPWIRAATADAVARVVGVRLYGSSADRREPEQQITLNGTPTTYYLLPYRSWGNGAAFSAADLVAMFLALREATSPIGSIRVYEAGIDVIYNASPTVTLDAVGSPVTTTGLVVAGWSFNDAEANLQQAYREVIFERPGIAWPLTGAADDEYAALVDAATVPVSDVTVLTDAVASDPVLLGPSGNYRRFLQVQDNAPGAQFGAWASQEWNMSVGSPPAVPGVTVTPDDAHARIAVELTPAPGYSIDNFELERSVDGGVTWVDVRGTVPRLAYVPVGANVINDGDFLADSDGDGFANGFSAYNTGGDAAPTGTLVAGGQQVAWVANSGNKGLVATGPRVGVDGSNIWPAATEWLISFDYSSDRVNNDMLPVVGFTAAGFSVAWIQQPDVSASPQGYLAKITVGGGDVEADLRVYSTGPASHHFTINHLQMSSAGVDGAEGYSTTPYGEGYYGYGLAATMTSSNNSPVYRAREDTTVTVYDRSVPRRVSVIYRARESTYSGSGAAWATVEKASEWVSAAPAMLGSDGNAWLQSSSDMAFDLAFCHAGTTFQASSHEDQEGFWAEGRSTAVVVSGTIHAETIPTVTLMLNDDDDWAAFIALRALQEPLLLRTLYGQDPMEQFWIRIGADVPIDRIGGYGAPNMESAQLRQVTFFAWPVPEPA